MPSRFTRSFFFLLIYISGHAQYKTKAQELISTNEDSLNAGTSKNRTVVSGYGSAFYQRDFNLKQSMVTLERAVLFVGHEFNQKISLFTELEVENAKVEGGKDGEEVSMEQAFLKFNTESTILSFVDAGDKNGDGITGKANYVYDVFTKKTELGRFGLKANTPNLLVQVASAYQQDMGVTSYVQSVESADGQAQMNVVHGDLQPELADTILNYVTFYVKSLAVPARRNVTDADVEQGSVLFNQANCSGCHRPTVQTGIDVTLSQISNQRIHPYTDLLLHDMGAALADGRPDYLATGTDWRTAPLWGIGLLNVANGTPYFLHDGRAKTLEEAILWHGGEAEKSKKQFMQLSKADRDRLIKFVNSL